MVNLNGCRSLGFTVNIQNSVDDVMELILTTLNSFNDIIDRTNYKIREIEKLSNIPNYVNQNTGNDLKQIFNLTIEQISDFEKIFIEYKNLYPSIRDNIVDLQVKIEDKQTVINQMQSDINAMAERLSRA